MLIPHTLQTIDIIAKKSAQYPQLFDPKSPQFNEVKKVFALVGDYKNHPQFTQNTDAVLLTQLISLTALSMVGGVFMPIIKQLSLKDETLKLNWGNQVIDRFTFAKYDTDYEKYCKYFRLKVLGHPHPPTSFNKTVLTNCGRMISYYQNIMSSVQETIQKLLVSKSELKQLFTKQINPDLLFILLSALPDTQINTFFLHIQSYLPNDLEVKHPDGHKIVLSQLFQSPSSDIQYLITKIQIYLSLYHTPQLPIIRHITQSKTATFFEKSLENQHTYDTTIATLTTLSTTHIQSRINLYTLYSTLITKLLA
jgi:hypothetical protein